MRRGLASSGYNNHRNVEGSAEFSVAGAAEFISAATLRCIDPTQAWPAEIIQ
jgi:hypothetical protein